MTWQSYGTSSRRCLPLLALLLLCSSLYSQEVEIDPAGIYEISGKQLIELRDTLTMQETQLDALEAELTRSRQGLTAVQNELTTSEKAIDALETSSMELSRLARSAEIRATMFRSLSIVLGTTTAGGVLFILATIFGSPMAIGD